MLKGLPAGLSALLIVQVTLALDAGRRQTKVVPIDAGQNLPFAVSDAGGTGPGTITGCRAAFLCTTRCPACAALAKQWADTPATQAMRPLWMLTGDSASVMGWARAHGLPLSEVRVISPGRATGWRTTVAGDLWFTPMRVILTPDMIVRDARPSASMPSDDTLRLLCNEPLDSAQ